MNEMPLARAVHLGLNRINQWETIFSPDETSLLIDFRMSSGLSGVAALLPEDGSSSKGYDLVKWSAAETPTLDVTLDDLWACTKEHYGLTAITAVAGIGGIPIRHQPRQSLWS